MIKYSRQREAIKRQLSDRGDHPTAETLYTELKQEMPNLSMATVYRNLRQLESWGEIASISTDGAARFDYDVRPHSHFFCTECGAVMDLDDDNEKVVAIGQAGFAGRIEGCASHYYGVCPTCMMKHRKEA